MDTVWIQGVHVILVQDISAQCAVKSMIQDRQHKDWWMSVVYKKRCHTVNTNRNTTHAGASGWIQPSTLSHLVALTFLSNLVWDRHTQSRPDLTNFIRCWKAPEHFIGTDWGIDFSCRPQIAFTGCLIRNWTHQCFHLVLD